LQNEIKNENNVKMKNWLNYFKSNRIQRRDIPSDHEINIEPNLRGPLIRSLQRFQVGESGEGYHLRRQAAKSGDADYQAAIDLFVKEEQEHARLMACVLRKLNAPLIEHHWSDACFILLRRLFGLHHELLVLLMPEMIAKRYFRALHDGFTDPMLRAICAQIVHDEEGHLAFHVDYLQGAFASRSLLARIVLRACWRVLFRAACLVVIMDHRAILRGAGVSGATFWWDCGLIFDEVAAAILSCAPTPAITKIGQGLKVELNLKASPLSA
jgi:hypothetical protein